MKGVSVTDRLRPSAWPPLLAAIVLEVGATLSLLMGIGAVLIAAGWR